MAQTLPILYSAMGCSFCEQAIAFLQSQAVVFEVRDVGEREEFLQEAETLGHRWLPILKYGETVLVGPDVTELKKFLLQHPHISS
ncbi:glutaredoxin family protein [Alicyclobacillaceae bacterium I2511]|nr:glutaredoxin family protein [Alicyclobacillaceae bacterium I2511]